MTDILFIGASLSNGTLINTGECPGNVSYLIVLTNPFRGKSSR